MDRDAHDEDGQPLVVGTYRLTREKDAARAGGFYTASEYDICADAERACPRAPNSWSWAAPAC